MTLFSWAVCPVWFLSRQKNKRSLLDLPVLNTQYNKDLNYLLSKISSNIDLCRPKRQTWLWSSPPPSSTGTAQLLVKGREKRAWQHDGNESDDTITTSVTIHWGWGNECKRPVLVVALGSLLLATDQKKLILGAGCGVSVISRSTWLNWYQSCKHMSQAKNESKNQNNFGSQIWIWQFSAKTRFGCQNFWSQYDFYKFRK